MLTLAVTCTAAGRLACSEAAIASKAAALKLESPATVSVDATCRSVTVTVTVDGSTPSSAA